MKCKFCGANIDIESAVCPFCGMAKSEFESHREDMQLYQKEFENTKAHVINENVKYGKLTGKITVLSILIGLNLLLLLLNSTAFSLSRRITDMKINANKETHFQVIDNYIENHDYQNLSFYCETNSLTYNLFEEEYAKYYPITSLATKFTYTLEMLGRVIHTIKTPIDSPSNYTSMLVSNYDMFLDSYNRYKDPEYSSLYYSHGSDLPFLEEIEEMHTILITTIQHYYNLSDEEIESFDELSTAHKEVLLETHVLEVTDEN